MSPSRSTASKVAATALAGLAGTAYLKRRQAARHRLTGDIALDIMDAPVTILRDKWGVPSAFAATEMDAYRAQGWIHAIDRTFQMDLLRRIGLGRLSEIVGEPGIKSDRMIRTLGFNTQVEAEFEMATPEVRMMLDAYTEGVNAAFEHLGSKPSIEYRLLRYEPEPWRPQDCLAMSRLMSLGLCGNWESELARGEIMAKFGNETLDTIDNNVQYDRWPAQIHPDTLGELVSAMRDATSTFGGPGGIGSNNWVIGPDRTRSGGAIMANDPHLDLQLPSVWYEHRLQGGDLDVRGFTFPGTPGIVLGHNGRISWGFTNSSIDVQDCYIEEIDDEAGLYKDVGGEWSELNTRTEVISVKGSDDITLEVRSTRRGPIITDAAVTTQIGDPISLRWDSIRPGNTSETLFQLNRATDWETFRSALSQWLAPAQNVVYADVDGNIGFQHMGEVPIRAEGNDGSMPHRGDDPSGEWTGTIPWEDHPHAFNPELGRIVTANDKLVSDDYPYFMSREWMNGYRGERIRSVIDSIEEHTVGDQVRLQTDVFSLPGTAVREILLQRDLSPATDSGREILNTLREWDGELEAGTDASAAWRLFQRAMQDQAFGFLGELLPRFLGYSRTGVNGFWSMFSRTTPRIIHDINADDTALLDHGRKMARSGETDIEPIAGWNAASSWDEFLTLTLDRAGDWWQDEAADELRVTPRSHPKIADHVIVRTMKGINRRLEHGVRRRWQYHRLRLQHPLGVLPGLAQLANRGPYAVPGDPDTVWQTSQFNNPTNDYAMVGPSHRHVTDMSDVDRNVAIVCGGISGHPTGAHYADQVDMWRSGEVRPAPFSRDVIERAAKYRQQLRPSE